MSNARLVDWVIGATTKRRLVRAPHEHLDHAWILSEAIDLRNSFRRVLRSDQDRPLEAIERANPRVQRPIIDPLRERRRQICVWLNAETEIRPSQNGEIDAVRIE